jgi:hypothetical protein
MGETRNEYKVLVGKPQERRPPGRFGCCWKYIINTDVNLYANHPITAATNINNKNNTNMCVTMEEPTPKHRVYYIYINGRYIQAIKSQAFIKP